MVLLPAYKPAAVLEEFQMRRITTFAGGPSALYMGFYYCLTGSNKVH
jgi:hypothetical protein